jgi:hypothetical protein
LQGLSRIFKARGHPAYSYLNYFASVKYNGAFFPDATMQV